MYSPPVSRTRRRYQTAGDPGARFRALHSFGAGLISYSRYLMISFLGSWSGCCRPGSHFSARPGKYVMDSLRHRPLLCLAIAASFLCFSPAARATTYLFDAAPNTTGTTLNYGNGTISTTSSNWWPSSSGTYSGWTNSISDTMQIGSTGTNNGRGMWAGARRHLLRSRSAARPR